MGGLIHTSSAATDAAVYAHVRLSRRRFVCILPGFPRGLGHVVEGVNVKIVTCCAERRLKVMTDQSRRASGASEVRPRGRVTTQYAAPVSGLKLLIKR